MKSKDTRGRKKRKDGPLPPNIRSALVARAAGANWNRCAEISNTSAANLREWRKHPEAEAYLNEAIEQNISEAHNLLAENAPKIAHRLIELSLREDIRPYAQVSAISECFRVLQNGVINKENREEIRKIRDSLEALEGNNVIDID